MALFSNPAIPLGSIMLVTGVNGLVGSHVADQLLAAGYRVRGTVRDVPKNSWMNEFFDQKYGSGLFELIEVKNMMDDGAFDRAVQGCTAVAHVASITAQNPDPNKVVPPAIRGVLNALESAAREPGVKRFVLTSSFVTVPKLKPSDEAKITVDSWDEGVLEAAWAPPPYSEERSYTVYRASKIQAEKELWRWVEEHKPGFVVNAVLPTRILGRPLSAAHQGHPSSTMTAAEIFKGNEQIIKFLNGVSPAWSFVDAQDVARLHVIALIHPGVEQERIFAFGGHVNINSVLAAFRTMFATRQFPEDIPDLPIDQYAVEPKIRAESLLKEFGRSGFTGLDECLRANVEDL